MSARDFPPPSIPLATLVEAHRVLSLCAHGVPDMPIAHRLAAAGAAGDLGYWVEKLLADQQAAVRVPA